MTAVEKWELLREFALKLPGAAEDFPWGESVVKVKSPTSDPPKWRRGLVHGPMFLWLGRREAKTPSIFVKLSDSYDEAIASEGAERTVHSGLGHWGWLTVKLSSVGIDLLREWVEESYRGIAPRKLVMELNERKV